MAMSLAATLLLLWYVAFGPRVHETDEGTGAHVFQILMGTQALIIAFFALKWLPQSPKPALKILVLQLFAALIPFVVLYFFEHH